MILVFGSAHLDILSKASDNNTDKIDRIGSNMSISIGGVGANVSSNLAYSGLPVTYCGVFKESPISDVICSYLKNNGIKTHFFYRKNMSLAGFNAHVNKDNEIFSSVVSIPDMNFRKYEVNSLIEKAKIVFLETNLPVKSIKLITDTSKKYSKPVFIQAACKHNSNRILSSDGYTCVIANVEEYMSVPSIKADNIFVTMGKLGVQYYHYHTKKERIFPAPDVKGFKSNLLGVGDAFTSAILKGYYSHKDFFDNLDLYYDDVNKFVRFVAVNNDVHLSKKYNSYLEEHMVNIKHNSEIDELTQVYNRKAGEKFLNEFYNSSSIFSVLFIDIDHFKNFNDTYGHDFGDLVLSVVAKTIADTIRKTDYVIRWGGEEFIVILNQMDIYNAKEFAERLLANVRNINVSKTSGDDIKITVSIGGSDNTQSVSLSDLINTSDKAMYMAKETGRDKYIAI